MNKLLYLLLMIICCSCTYNSETEKHQYKRDNIINVRDKLKEIKIDNVLIGAYPQLFLINECLIISDNHSYDKMLHVFDKGTFRHLVSTGTKGEGPGEIIEVGYVGIDETNRVFYVSDWGKQTIFSYKLDNVLSDSLYMPEVKIKMKGDQFPAQYQYINDTLSIGTILTPIGTHDFKPVVAKWNMITGAVKPMEYEHPDIEKKRICFAVSMKNGVYVECYSYNDLMTICDIDGKLKCNIYGSSDWNKGKSNRTLYYAEVAFCKDKIVATYSGGNTFSKREDGSIKSNSPTKFMVFDINGNYIRTLETEHEIGCFCYDEKNDRIIMYLQDSDMQFVYLDADDIL